MRPAYLARRNPTVLLGLVLATSVVTLFLHDVPRLGALYALLLLAALAGARFPPGRLVLAQIPFVLFAAGIVVVNALTRPAPEGLVIGVALGLRALAIGTASLILARAAEPRALMVSLVQHARLSPRVAYALMAGHRMLEQLPGRWRTITRAHLVRSGRDRLSPRQLGRCAFALLVGSLRSGERLAFALESRGLTDGPRTVWRPVPLGRGDALLVAVCALVVAAVVAVPA